jgi:hydrogenase nickel incorporation protein HypB
MTKKKTITARRSILSANDRQAAANARLFKKLDLTTINIMASPGAGKTSLLVRLLKLLAPRGSVGVIEGDVASSIDAELIARLGYPVTQINTDGGCHLNASDIAAALAELNLSGPGYLFIENIGNLICPAAFDLGERARLVIASVPEGDDKPCKYPGIFMKADAIVLNKIDTLAVFDFDRAAFTAGVRAVNSAAPIFELSCRTGQGMQALADWLLALRTM